MILLRDRCFTIVHLHGFVISVRFFFRRHQALCTETRHGIGLSPMPVLGGALPLDSLNTSNDITKKEEKQSTYAM